MDNLKMRYLRKKPKTNKIASWIVNGRKSKPPRLTLNLLFVLPTLQRQHGGEYLVLQLIILIGMFRILLNSVRSCSSLFFSRPVFCRVTISCKKASTLQSLTSSRCSTEKSGTDNC